MVAKIREGEAEREQFVFAVVRGDMDVNETKLANAVRAKELRPAREEEILATGATPWSKARGLTDRDGVRLVDAMAEAGLDDEDPQPWLGPDAIRCFVASATKIIMPAFGSLTGGLDAHHPEILRSVGGSAAALVPLSDRLLRVPLAA